MFILRIQKRGRRAKLLAEDGNEIDTMFLDRRNDGAYPHGNTLVRKKSLSLSLHLC